MIPGLTIGITPVDYHQLVTKGSFNLLCSEWDFNIGEKFYGLVLDGEEVYPQIPLQIECKKQSKSGDAVYVVVRVKKMRETTLGISYWQYNDLRESGSTYISCDNNYFKVGEEFIGTVMGDKCIYIPLKVEERIFTGSSGRTRYKVVGVKT